MDAEEREEAEKFFKNERHIRQIQSEIHTTFIDRITAPKLSADTGVSVLVFIVGLNVEKYSLSKVKFTS